MANEKVKLITHPQRAQIITALTKRELTIAQLAAVLPEIPLPSLYRHVRLLVDGGILEAVREVRVHGALTKVFGLTKASTTITPEDTRGEPIGDHTTYFSAFTEMLNASFRNYLSHEKADPANDLMSALMTVLYIAPEEKDEFQEDIHQMIRKWEERVPHEHAERILVAQIVIPDKTDPPLV